MSTLRDPDGLGPVPPWGTKEALRWGVAHPDWPWHTKQTRREYEYPNGRWWVRRRRRGAA